MKTRTHGFTLIELLVVIAIIGILAALLFPVVNEAIVKGHTIATGNDGRQIWLGLFAENNERMLRGDPEIWPRSGDYAETTTFFQDCFSSNWLGSEFTFKFMGGPGLQRIETDDPADFAPENNAWCMTLDLGEGAKGQTPFLFTRNALGGSTLDAIDSLDHTAKPFGESACVAITYGGAVRGISRNEAGRDLQRSLNPTEADNAYIRP